MKHGQHIPKNKRDDMARMAFAIASTMSPAQAKEVLAGMYDVSATTASKLISRGRHLAVNEAETAASAVQGEG